MLFSRRIRMNKRQYINALILFSAMGSSLALAQQPPAAPPMPMSFFVTSSGSGKGADLGGIAGADQRCHPMAQPVPTQQNKPVRTGPAAPTAQPSLGISNAPAAAIPRGIRRTRHADAAMKIWSAPAAQVCSTASQRSDDQYFGGSKLFLV